MTENKLGQESFLEAQAFEPEVSRCSAKPTANEGDSPRIVSRLLAPQGATNHNAINANDEEKYILDVCCGCRQFWFNKKQSNTIYMDRRVEERGFQDARPNKEIKPDVIGEFGNIPFPSERFKLVIMDPPHIISNGPLFRMTKEYGWLEQDTWFEDIRAGVKDCWRVLEYGGIFIFKWNEASIKRADVLRAIKWEPLIGHPVLSKIGTHWFTFMKIRGENPFE